MNQFIRDWGLAVITFLPLAGALVMLLIPKGEEQTHKAVALVSSLAAFGVGIWLLADFDYLYTDVIVAAVKRPIAGAVNWVNQHVIDAVVNGAGRSAVATGQWVYDKVDQSVVDSVVNGTGVVANESGGELSRVQTGHIQQYAALFFAAAAVLAGVFVLVVGR